MMQFLIHALHLDRNILLGTSQTIVFNLIIILGLLSLFYFNFTLFKFRMNSSLAANLKTKYGITWEVFRFLSIFCFFLAVFAFYYYFYKLDYMTNLCLKYPSSIILKYYFVFFSFALYMAKETSKKIKCNDRNNEILFIKRSIYFLLMIGLCYEIGFVPVVDSLLAIVPIKLDYRL